MQDRREESLWKWKPDCGRDEQIKVEDGRLSVPQARKGR